MAINKGKPGRGPKANPFSRRSGVWEEAGIIDSEWFANFMRRGGDDTQKRMDDFPGVLLEAKLINGVWQCP